MLPTAEGHGTFSFDQSYNGSWNPKNSKTITLDNRTGVGFTRMHTIYLLELSFKYALSDSPDTLFFFYSGEFSFLERMTLQREYSYQN